MEISLRKLIIESVGDDIADDDYLAELGYDEDTLNTPPLAYAKLTTRHSRHSCGDIVYKLQEGYHLSTATAEFYVDPDEGEGVIEDIEALPEDAWLAKD